MNYFGKRYLDGEVGVWTGVDPVDEFWNPYSYSNNPIRFVDPKGLSVMPSDFIGPLNSCDVYASQIGLPSNTWWTGFNIYLDANNHSFFTTEADAGIYAGFVADYLYSQKPLTIEVGAFILNDKANSIYKLGSFQPGIGRDEINLGPIPRDATATFHTHLGAFGEDGLSYVNSQRGDEAYGYNNKLNMYMHNVTTGKSDFKSWAQCSPSFSPLNISPP